MPQATVLNILYHISVDEKHLHQFGMTECLAIAMRLLLAAPAGGLDVLLMALCINLATNGRNAEIICAKGGLKFLVKRESPCPHPFAVEKLSFLTDWSLL